MSASELAQKTGLTQDELRDVVGGIKVAPHRRVEFLARLRDAGLSLEQAKEILSKQSDTNSEEGSGNVSDRLL